MGVIMKLTHLTGSINFEKDNHNYSFLPTGDIYEFTSGNILLNSFIGSKKEGSAGNIWIRIYKEKTKHSFPLLGVLSQSSLKKSTESLNYYGEIEGISYSVTFSPSGSIWFWTVQLEGQGQTVDLIYGQDIGLAEKDAVLENELYTSQYIDHTILNQEHGYVVCSRQNLPQSDSLPYLQQGILDKKTIAYCTDGTQFFGSSYAMDGRPACLSSNLESRKLQGESSYIGLQSETFTLNQPHKVTFYCCFHADHPHIVDSVEYQDKIKSAYEGLKHPGTYEILPPVNIKPIFGSPYVSPQWSEEKISQFFPCRKLEEYQKETLLSFFTPEDAHVVLQQKELLSNRPHGNIVTTQADLDKVNNRLLTSTHYIYGLFNGQSVIGNTSKHKLLSTPRGLLNLLKNSGQRIYILIEGQYRLLTLPALFEMGFSYSRWYYELEEDIITITSYAISDQGKVILEASSLKHKSYDFIITNQLVMGTHEFTNPVILEENNGYLSITPDSNNPILGFYPSLRYDISVEDIPFTFSDDRIFFEDGTPQNTTLLTISINNQHHFKLSIAGSLDGETTHPKVFPDFEIEKKSYSDYYTSLLNHFHLDIQGGNRKKCEILNTSAKWYAHNAMVHFAVPHGLEQPGGAAWGTRDICQGPLEFFYATQKNQLSRHVLLTIFSHQSDVTGEWPQWFMFDRYPNHQEDCHGDVVLWPLKAAATYLKSTNDTGILDEKLGFLDNPTQKGVSLLEHIKLAVTSVTSRFLEGTHLISYGGGDWDDTLQPANEKLKEQMVSSWTQALSYQVLSLLSEVLTLYDLEYSLLLKEYSNKIKEDFFNYLVIDGISAGFVYRCPDGSFAPMLHPKDKDTGIQYRLLPMTRSIIAEMADQDLAENYLSIIEERLHCPDGVRLMDRPAPYHGGNTKLFRRAEQAANVGREISLQYTHAHIRYIEALCHMGKASSAWDALFEINPICINETVPNAQFRQSNLYFSSSEGAYYDRYEYDQNFHLLKEGNISVKGGWRLYSSGPGIYLNQLITGVLGISFENNSITISPVLPKSLDGLSFTFDCFGQTITFVYHVSDSCCRRIHVMQNGVMLPSASLSNSYEVPRVQIEKQFIRGSQDIHVYMEK